MLVTARAKLLKRAIEDGIARSGNHEIRVVDDVVTFYFRGTPITEWNKVTGVIVQDSHGYSTISTAQNQHKNARAVEEFKFERACGGV